MLRYVVYAVIVVAVIGLVASGIHLYKVGQKNKKEMAQYEGSSLPVMNNLGKVLVVYYSLSGHTKDIAQRIGAKTQADMFEIKTFEPIEANAVFYMKSRQQLKSGKYPKLVDAMPDFSQYDTIFVGFPVWWYTMATPALAFLEKADFLGKRVVPFSTQGSNIGTSFVDFVQKAQNADLLQSASFNNLPEKYNDAVDNKISEWLNNL